MTGLPEVTVTGTLVADPEVKFVASGDAVCNFKVAANSRRYDRERGEWVDGDTTFLRCSIWRQAAENVSESLTQGTRVLVTGRLKQRSWETEDGEKRSVMELDVDEIGPSLRWATATVTKATRASTPPKADTWTQPAPATAAARSGFSNEPPF